MNENKDYHLTITSKPFTKKKLTKLWLELNATTQLEIKTPCISAYRLT